MPTQARLEKFKQLQRDSRHAVEDSCLQLQRGYEQAHENYLATLIEARQQAWDGYAEACREYYEALGGGRAAAPAQQHCQQTYQTYLERLRSLQAQGDLDREAAKAYGKYLHALNEAAAAAPDDSGAAEQCHSEYLDTLAALGRSRVQRQRDVEEALVDHLIASQEAAEESARHAEQAYRGFLERLGELTKSLNVESRWQEASRRYMDELSAAWQRAQRQQLDVAEAALQASRALLESMEEEELESGNAAG